MVVVIVCKLEVVFSWKFDSFSTYSLYLLFSSINVGRLILLFILTLIFVVFVILFISVVIVFLSLESVIVIIGVCVSRQNSSISLTISISVLAVAFKDGCVSVISGLAIIRFVVISYLLFRLFVWRFTVSGNLFRLGGVIRVFITRGVISRARKKFTQESSVRFRSIMTIFLF